MKRTITIEEQCPDCCGNGFHTHDSCDHQGEHVQSQYPCETCEGSGLMPEGYEETEDFYYTAPRNTLFEEVRAEAMKIWGSYKEPYRTEKMDRIKDLKNVSDNFMYIVAMFDMPNQTKLADNISPEAREAIRKQMIAGGALLGLSIFN